MPFIQLINFDHEIAQYHSHFGNYRLVLLTDHNLSAFFIHTCVIFQSLVVKKKKKKTIPNTEGLFATKCNSTLIGTKRQVH